MAVKEPTGDLKKACWKGYTAVGMKMKNGRKVPNCVPANEEREIPLSHRTKHNVSHYRVLNNGRDVSKHDSYEEAIAHAGEHRRRLKSKGYADKISVHAYVKEEVEKLHITLKDSLGNVHHIYRTPKGHVFASHAGVNISPAQHAYKHNGSNSERERLVANIIKKAKSSQHAAELMNSSGLGSTNWSAKEIKEEKENYGLPAHSMKHVMQKIKDGHWEVSSGEVKSGQHLSIIDHTKGKKKRMIHVKEESNKPKDREWGTTKLTKRYKKDTPGQCDCDTMKEESDQITEDAKRDRVSADLHKQGIGSHWRNPQTLVVHDKHKKKVQQHMDKITGGWVHVVGHSEEPMNEETVGRKKYKVALTVSHSDVASGNKKDVRVNVNASSREKAIETAEKHYRKAGYKVHKDLSFIHSVNEEAGQMDEAATSKNPHYGYHGTQEKDADKKYSAMHTRVKKVVGAAGHLGDVKKPNVVVRHYLDSVRGRHADGRSDGYIARDFAKFKKTYKPEMHEEVSQMDEGITKKINKRMKNTLSAMRGRAAIGEPEKGLSWQQNKAKAIKAGRAMAKEEIEQIDELKKSTMASYLPKAAASYGRDKQLIGRESPDGTVAKARPELKRSVKNRLAGIQRASQKLAKEEFKAGDKVHLGLTTKGGSGMKGTLRKIEGGTAHIEVDDPTSKYGPRIVKGKVSNLSMREEVEQISEGPQRDAAWQLRQKRKHIASMTNKEIESRIAGWEKFKEENPNMPHKVTHDELAILRAERASRIGKKKTNEEFEQIDELKRDTLISYVGKAYADKKRRKGKNAVAAMTGTLDDYLKGAKKSDNRSTGITRAYARLNKKVSEELEQMDEMKSSNPKGLAYKITAASHAANPSYGPHDPSVDPKTNFGAGATRSSAVAGLRAARAIKKAGGNPHDPEHIETISKAIHGSPADYGGKSRGWSHHALTSTNQSPEQKERRSKLTGAYGSLSNDEQEKDRQIARVIANRVRPVKESVGRDATKQLIARIKKAGGNAKRNKAGLLVPTGKPKAKLEEATGEDVYKDLRAQGVPHHVAMSRAREHEEKSKSRDYQGYHTQIHVDGRHYKAGDRLGAGERGAQDAARHAVNIAKKTGKQVSIHMVHHETGKTLAIADYKDGKFKYRNLSEEAHHPIPSGHKNTSGGKSHGNTAQRHDLPITPRRGELITPKPGVKVDIRPPHGRKPKPRKVTDVLVLDPPNKPRRIKETRDIIREAIAKKQKKLLSSTDGKGKPTIAATKGKTATGQPLPQITMNPVIDVKKGSR